MTIGRIPSVEGGIQPTIVDAKGDLIAAVAADSVNRLAVGSNDQVLVADSSTSTGLAWKSYAAQFVAGKNAIINGGMDIWQRGTTVNSPSDTYLADRWRVGVTASAGTPTYSQQTFTPGTAPVAGYEGQYFLRVTTGTTATYFEIAQFIEDVRTFAGQTVTLSYWAKASSSVGLKVLLRQSFGTGGSANADTSGTTATLTTSWARYTTTVTLPSVSGKTIGASSSLRLFLNQDTGALGGLTIDLWGVQLEAGSVATPFSRAAGTIQGELAACQRYYYLFVSGTGKYVGIGANYSATQLNTGLTFPVTMRTAPTLSASSGTNYYSFGRNGSEDAFNSFTIFAAQTNGTLLYNNSEISGTAGHGGSVSTNDASASIAFSAEL